MTFGITPEETTVSNGAPATKACIRTISLWTLRWGLHSLTGKRMVPAIITKRQVRPRLVPAIPPLAHPRPPTSTVICVLKALATISKRTNTNGEMCHNMNPIRRGVFLARWGYFIDGLRESRVAPFKLLLELYRDVIRRDGVLGA